MASWKKLQTYLCFCVLVGCLLLQGLYGYVVPSALSCTRLTCKRLSLLRLHYSSSSNSGSNLPVEEEVFNIQSLDSFTRPSSSSAAVLTTQSSLISQNYETDFLGMVNFCLRTSDTTLSGPSRSKVLNEITNDVCKALLINFNPLIDATLQNFSELKERVQYAPCVLDRDERMLQESTMKVLQKADFSSSSDSVEAAEPMNISNCEHDLYIATKYIQSLEELLQSGKTNDVMLGGIYDRGYKRLLTVLRDAHLILPSVKPETFRPYMHDQNICLSVADVTFASDRMTKTKELNQLSNVVARCILYGSRKEREFVARALNDMTTSFADMWCQGNLRSQEILYIRALALLLKENLAVAEAAITNTEEYIEGEDDSMKLRLFDTYQNAFHRVVEVCLTEIGSQTTHSTMQTDEVLKNFLIWEQGLRRDLTMDLWNMNPDELVGKWELADVRGSGSLKSIMTSDTDSIFESIEGMTIEFLPEGKLDVYHPLNLGQKWYFKPGPAHLDTCEFYIQSKIDPDLVLKYIGFIDRGQRIESRFSKSPIRMTGRVVSVVKGEIRGSSRFIMVLKRK